MAITIEEKANGRSGDTFQRQVVYIVKGTDNDAAAIDAILNDVVYGVPITWDGLPQQTVAVEQQAPTIWYATVTYGSRDPSGGGPAAGTVTFNFETAVESVRITQSLETVYPEEGSPFQGGINVREDGSFEGVDVSVPASSFSFDFKLSSGTWNQTYITGVQRTVGAVNSDANWHGAAAGEVMLVGVAGSESSDGQPTLSFRFKYSQNTTVSLPGGFDNIPKDGHDYLWVHTQKNTVRDDNDQGLHVRPQIKGVYVERLFPRVNFLATLKF